MTFITNLRDLANMAAADYADYDDDLTGRLVFFKDIEKFSDYSRLNGALFLISEHDNSIPHLSGFIVNQPLNETLADMGIEGPALAGGQIMDGGIERLNDDDAVPTFTFLTRKSAGITLRGSSDFADYRSLVCDDPVEVEEVLQKLGAIEPAPDILLLYGSFSISRKILHEMVLEGQARIYPSTPNAVFPQKRKPEPAPQNLNL